MKRTIFLSLVFISSGIFSAQTDSLKDYFPLKTGNRWTYSLRSTSSSSMVHSSTEDNGTVSYEIKGSTNGTAGIIWTIIQRRVLLRSSFFAYSWHYETIKDSSIFELIESENGFHELYTSSTSAGLFGFQYSQADSSKFYRYESSDNPDIFIRRINFKDPYNPPAVYNYKYTYEMRADTGIVDMAFSHTTVMSWNRADYQLMEFRMVSNNPHLGIPKTPIRLETMFGKEKDTTIVIRNDGLEVLHISQITSSNPKFTVVDYSSSIEPLSNGFIKVRFYSSVEENINGELSIISNSETSNDVILLSGRAYAKAIIQLVPDYEIYFGSIDNGGSSFRIYTIFSKGNIPIRIDSIRIDSPLFRNSLRQGLIMPGSSVTDTIYFYPIISGFHDGRIKIYHNSAQTYSSIRIYGYSSNIINLAGIPVRVDFGLVDKSGFKNHTIAIRNLGTDSISISPFFKSNRSGNEATPFYMVTNFYNRWLRTNESLEITVMFKPESNSYARDHLVIFCNNQFGRSEEKEILLEGNLYFNLEQNYPNPFNSETKIRFTLDAKSGVTLRIFDFLGREVATLINEVLGPGQHEKVLKMNLLASGVYFYNLTAGDKIQTRKLIFVK